MAFKTMIRQLISKWGIMSIDMQKAFVSDMGVIDDSGNVDYVDNRDEYGSSIVEDDREKISVEAVSDEPDDLDELDSLFEGGAQ